jgi:hypothetical protein
MSQTLATNQTFNGQSGLVAVESAVTLQGCAPTAFDTGSEPVTETDYFADGTSQTVLVGSTMQWNDILGNKQTVKAVYTSPGLVVGELPFKPGRTWSSAATRTITWSSSDNSTAGPTSQETLVVNADGSYNETLLETGGTVYPYDSVTTTENSNASGKRTEVTQVEGASAPGPAYGLTLSAPANNTVIVTPFGTPPLDPLLPTPSPSAAPTPYPQHAWYPYVPTAAHPLETITSTDKGSAALPASCNTSAVRKSAELIETVDATLDIWSGTTTSTTDAYVDAHGGVLCANVTVRFAYYALGATSADTTPTGGSTLTFTDALQSQTSPPAAFAAPALARYLTLWR